MKISFATFALILSMIATSAFACSNGEFGIQYFNNKFDGGVTVAVQSALTGQTLVQVGDINKNASAQLCFPPIKDKNVKDYPYKVMEFTANQGNFQYNPLTFSTLVRNGYFMEIYATDSNFRPSN